MNILGRMDFPEISLADDPNLLLECGVYKVMPNASRHANYPSTVYDGLMFVLTYTGEMTNILLTRYGCFYRYSILITGTHYFTSWTKLMSTKADVEALLTGAITSHTHAYEPSVNFLEGSIVWDPGSIADGAAVSSGSVTVVNAAVGDFVLVSSSGTVPNALTLTGRVTSSGVVTIYLQNGSSAAIDPASQTWYVKVIKR